MMCKSRRNLFAKSLIVSFAMFLCRVCGRGARITGEEFVFGAKGACRLSGEMSPGDPPDVRC